LAQFKRDYHLNYPLISDESRTIYNTYANKGIPRLLLLDEDNRLIQEENGEDVYALERLLNLL
jgi:peroxiredoxin